jgi:hypothetical protein
VLTSFGFIVVFSFIIFVFVLFAVDQLSYFIIVINYDHLFYEFTLIISFQMFFDGKHHVFDLSTGLVIDKDHFDIAEVVDVIMDDMAV